MEQALGLLIENFANFWGQRLLGALRALHAIAFNQEEEDDSDFLHDASIEDREDF